MGCDGWRRRTGTDFSLCEKLPADSVPVSFKCTAGGLSRAEILGGGVDGVCDLSLNRLNVTVPPN